MALGPRPPEQPPRAHRRAEGGRLQLVHLDLDTAVVARAQADAQHHVAAWRPGYEGSLDVSLSWIIASRELGIGARVRARYLVALAAEARRLHVKLVVRAATAAVDWVHGERPTRSDDAPQPDETFHAQQWGVVSQEIGAQVDNGLLRAALERLVRVAVAREAAYVTTGPGRLGPNASP
jgi:hypothetical protein